MFWEELTAVEFENAKKNTAGLCIVPFGVVEKHGTHLPLGTDMMIGRAVASEAAKIEPFVIFPYYFFGQIAEARHVPGTISVSPQLMYNLLEEVCGEISRNGFNKIVLLNSHGGNCEFIRYFIQSTLYRKRDYAVYMVTAYQTEADEKKISEILGTGDLGEHGGNCETAMLMGARPDLVRMDCVEKEGLVNYSRLSNFNGIYTAMWWYAMHPTHFAGNPFSATRAAGQEILQMLAERVAQAVKVIKDDNTVLQLQNQFFFGG